MEYERQHPDLYDGNTDKIMELYSSAYSLSDMEIFLFPDLLYSLVLAEIMSPRLWQWREDRWFKGIREMPERKRIQRLKQYIMDNYTFNLDLDTWGLTTKERELERFSPFIDVEQLEKSNALFGYEGDKYYFSIDIRRHFGLDKYNSNVIPYWKTETLEAMDAFRHKPDWDTGGGECVSLSVLYAAALFVVAGIPLEDIYLMATPLHSQNYVDLEDGILTNNRRLVTKTMFFNGTELSDKARRALENEQITVVSNRGRYMHSLYREATIAPEAYDKFSGLIRKYLKIKFDPELFGNFLRCHPEFQPCFAYRMQFHKKDYYVGAETAFRYEMGSKLKLSDKSRKKLLAQINQDDCYPDKIPGRLIVNDVEQFIREKRIDLDTTEGLETMRREFCTDCEKTCDIIKALRGFIHVEPRLPEASEKQFLDAPTIELSNDMEREAVVEYLAGIRSESIAADLAFHAYRLPGKDSKPYWKAALERNPVTIEMAGEAGLEDICKKLQEMPDESIYDGNRLAQPDEVWNFGVGDGLEKAASLVNIILGRGKQAALKLSKGEAVVSSDGESFTFPTAKELPPIAAEEVYPGFVFEAG